MSPWEREERWKPVFCSLALEVTAHHFCCVLFCQWVTMSQLHSRRGDYARMWEPEEGIIGGLLRSCLLQSHSPYALLLAATLAAFQSLCTKGIFENTSLIMSQTDSHQVCMVWSLSVSPVSSLTLHSSYTDWVPSPGRGPSQHRSLHMLSCLPPAPSAQCQHLIWIAARLLPPQGCLRQPRKPAPFPVFCSLLLSTWLCSTIRLYAL